MPSANTRLAKVAVQFSAETFLLYSTSVLRIGICGENRHLRQAWERRYFEASSVASQVETSAIHPLLRFEKPNSP